MKKFFAFLFTPWFMGVLFIVYTMSMAFATFYENDFGATAAKTLVYNTKWFELVMVLMVINLLGQIVEFKLYKRKKLTILIFHFAFVLILIGAGITRYFGFEGMLHIREGKTQNICTSIDKYLKFEIKDLKGNELFSDSKKMAITSVRSEKYRKSVKINNENYSLKFTGFIPNATEQIFDIENGTPIVDISISTGMTGRQNIILKQGEIKNVSGILVGFNGKEPVDISIILQDNSFKIQSQLPLSDINMMSQEANTYLEGEMVPFEKMKIYKVKDLSFVPETLTTSGIIKAVKVDYKTQQTNKSVMVFELGYGNKLKELYLWSGQGYDNKVEFENENQKIEVSYKSLELELPFSIKLEDFILDRYPGSSSPSSYKSNVLLIDEESNMNMPYSIYMNHILKYKGWRFYQSSYDRDELGTILSVSKDFIGMLVTYIGYFMLFLFIVLSLINKNSSFRTITKNAFKSSSAKVGVLILLMLSSSLIVNSQNLTPKSHSQKFVIEKSVADKFGEVLVQNQKGRTEPLYALSNDILRKVSHKTKIVGYTPMQVFLGIYFDFQNWQNVPLISVSNGEAKKLIGISGDFASFTDLFDMRSNYYKIQQYVDAAYAKPAGARDKFDKEVIKIDERVNICYMIYTGEFLKIFPVKDKSLKWRAPKEAYKFGANTEDSLYLKNIMNLFAQSAFEGQSTGNFKQSEEYINSIITYQRNFAQYELPSARKVKAEIFYFKTKIYERLFPFYATAGILLLFILLYGIIVQNISLKKVINIFQIVIIIGFLLHTVNLVIYWYISGHAPMSNGYESMIFISWVTILAGFIFRKMSAFVLAAASVLGGFTLMVAHFSFMDPQITNLVPVLQSYWLTLHVSVIISSYGFLGIGAIIGLIVLILYSLSSPKNKTNIITTIEELTVINYKALTIGLYLLTIGTFLGAIWANESWGRYWGWDPKETWSLITIIVYSFITHSRMIKGLKGLFSFNVLALFGFSSVLMTYFGVNYYLSGLHSYAGGDPVPVPKFVYISVVLLVTLSFFSYGKNKKVNK